MSKKSGEKVPSELRDIKGEKTVDHRPKRSVWQQATGISLESKYIALPYIMF
jgi:hypothetical protein